MKGQERKARQQLNAFLLRHGYHWPRGKTDFPPRESAKPLATTGLDGNF
jgi:hypothetical protein